MSSDSKVSENNKLELIKRLREETLAGFADIKEALECCHGDYQKAKDYLIKKGLAKGEKKIESGRQATQGIIVSYVHFNGQVGVLVEINCETDFVARSDEFKKLGYEIAVHICAMSPSHVSASDIPNTVIEEIKEELTAIPKLASNPDLLEKALQDRLKEYSKQACLLEQPYLKDNSLTVGDLIKSLSAKVGEIIKVARFVRFSIGDR